MTSKTQITFKLLNDAYKIIEDQEPSTIDFTFKGAKAKSGETGQQLSTHLSAVGFVAGEIVKKFIRDGDGGKDTDLGDFANIAYAGAVLGGLFHDIGKGAVGFQNHIKENKLKENKQNKTIQAQLPHEITGLQYFNSKIDSEPFQTIIGVIVKEAKIEKAGKRDTPEYRVLLRCIRQSILWHHGRRRGDRDFGTAGWDDLFGSSIFDEETPYVFQYSPTINKKDTNFGFWSAAYKKGGLESLLKWVIKVEIDTIATSLREYFYGSQDHQSCTKAQFRTETENNALADICLKAVIAADRYVSTMTEAQLTTCMTNWDISPKNALAVLPSEEDIFLSLPLSENSVADGWDEGRWKNSWKSARKYDDKCMVVNKMMAGLGKTAWTMQHLYGSKETSQKKTVWIAPRLPICNGVYEEMKAFFHSFKLTGVVSIRTGEVKECVRFQKGVRLKKEEIDNNTPINVNDLDILITTVDYYVSANLASVRDNSLSVDFFASNLVIDEFHEFVNLENMLPVLATSVEARKHIKAKTILLSATPNPPLIKMLGLGSCLMSDEDAEFSELTEESERPDPIRKKISLQVHLGLDKKGLDGADLTDRPADDESAKLVSSALKKKDGRSFLFAQNSVAASQFAFATQMVSGATGVHSVLFHGSYARFSKGGAKSAWKMGFDKIMDTFGKDSGVAKDYVCYSAAILRASLNVSFDDMVHYTAGPDNDLQLIGRLDRFAKSATTDFVPTLSMLLPKKNEGNGAAVEFLYDLEVAGRWLALVAEKSSVANGPIKNIDFYGWYREFYDAEYKQKAFSAYDLMSAQMLKGMANIAGGFFAPLKGKDSKSEVFQAADEDSSGQQNPVNLPLLDHSGAMVWSSDDSKSPIFVSGLYHRRSYNPKRARLEAKNVARLINKTGAPLSVSEIEEEYQAGEYQTYKDIQSAIAATSKADKKADEKATEEVVSDFVRSHQFYHHGAAEIKFSGFNLGEYPSKKDGLRGDSFYVAIPSMSHRADYPHLYNHGIGLGLLDMNTAYIIDKQLTKSAVLSPPKDFIRDQIKQSKKSNKDADNKVEEKDKGHAVPSRYYAPATDKDHSSTVWIPLTINEGEIK